MTPAERHNKRVFLKQLYCCGWFKRLPNREGHGTHSDAFRKGKRKVL